MTGRLQQGDHVRTPDGPGVVIATHIATHRINPAAYHVVELDHTGERKPYREDVVEFLGRQLALDEPNA